MKQNSPSKLTVATALAAAAGIAFTTILLAPLDLYLNNATNYQIGFVTEFIPLLLVALFGFGVLTLILLLPVWRTKPRNAALLILWGIIIAAYVQTLFMNGEMKSITGDGTFYSEYTPRHIINLFIYIIIIVMPLCIWKGMDDKGKTFHFEKPLIFTVILIIGMQLAGVISAAVTHTLPTGYENSPMYLTYGPTLEAGNEQNIDVFIFDRLDVKYMQEALEEYPTIADSLDGFTFYENNVSEYTNTFPSVSKMLTGAEYRDGDDWVDYWHDAWSRRTLPDILGDNGYATNLLIDKSTTFDSFDELAGRADNARVNDNITIKYGQIIKTNLSLSTLRILPYMLKDFPSYAVSVDFGNEFFSYDFSDGQLPNVGTYTDISYYDYLRSHPISIGSSTKTFNFTHLNCAHSGELEWGGPALAMRSGYHLDEATGDIVPGGSRIESIRACFAIMNLYIQGLKAIGAYDNTTIIILGDHGRAPVEIQNDTNSRLESEITTALLVKPNDAHGTLKINTNAELSNRYLAASILEVAGLPHEDFGLSYQDVIDMPDPPLRQLYLNWWRDAGDIDAKGYYEISGDANDFANWRYLP